MALQSNGQLLIEVAGHPFASVFAHSLSNAPSVLKPLGYTIEPLFRGAQHTALFAEHLPGTHWALARTSKATTSKSPWDAAHDFARANNYAYYVEPDLLHEAPRGGAVEAAGMKLAAEADVIAPPGMKEHWPPHEAVSAGWHLEAGFTNFVGARQTTKGAGIRIAHLDTGFTPNHFSNPAHLRTDLGRDFWDTNRKNDASDPHTSGVLYFPGHGTATLALLAGKRINFTYMGIPFDAEIGGAPEAEIVPVRICPSVIHLYTSSMAHGLDYALAPGDDASQRCDVVSISHGGLPAAAWAAAVNKLYEAGVIIVAASGDNIKEFISVPSRFTVYPAAFNRVITAAGCTYDKQPYIATHNGDVQGSWGPDAVMEKAIAAYTPNVAWMDYNFPNDVAKGFTMSGGGTSASTPQIAAACALWLSEYGGDMPKDWRRVEACRWTMFMNAKNRGQNKSKIGQGLLDAASMLDAAQAAHYKQLAMNGGLHISGEDEVNFPFWRVLLGIAPPNSAQERMYETEAAQIVLSSDNEDLIAASQKVQSGLPLNDADRAAMRAELLKEPISDALRARILAAP